MLMVFLLTHRRRTKKRKKLLYHDGTEASLSRVVSFLSLLISFLLKLEIQRLLSTAIFQKYGTISYQ